MPPGGGLNDNHNDWKSTKGHEEARLKAFISYHSAMLRPVAGCLRTLAPVTVQVARADLHRSHYYIRLRQDDIIVALLVGFMGKLD